MAHPRESDEWKSMDLEGKYEFFAPIWRIMRDDNMTVEEVRGYLGERLWKRQGTPWKVGEGGGRLVLCSTTVNLA